jgi:hypothetical protein
MQVWLPCVLLFCIFIPLSAQNADSLAYYMARDSILLHGTIRSEAMVQAADELAAEGLYEEALSLVTEVPEQIKADSIEARRAGRAGHGSVPAVSPVSQKREQPLSWRISGAADYLHWEDLASVDTSRPESRDSLARLLENPLTISAKALLSWKPASGIVKSVEPSLYVGNQKSVLDVTVDMPVNRLLSVTAGLKAEKRLTNRYSDTGEAFGSGTQTVFTGDRKDSLDMGGGRFTVTPGFNKEAGGTAWQTPVTIEAARYRHGRAGYYSFNDFRIAPELSFVTGDMRESGALRFVAERKDYMGGATGAITRADSFDIYRIGPEISGELWRQRFSANATLGFLYERYPHRGVPYDIRTMEAEGLARARPFRRLEASIRTRYENRIEYDKGEFVYCRDTTRVVMGIPVNDTLIDTMQTSFMVRGYDAGIVPSLRWSIVSALSLELRCLLSRRSYTVADSLNGGRLSAPLFILESRDAIEPELGFEYSGSYASIRVSGAYAVENVPEREYYTLSSNRDWKVRGDCMAKLTKHISCYIQADYEFRRYAPYEKNSRTSINLTTAAGFSARF